MKLHSTYMKCNIYLTKKTGILPYSSYVNGRFVYSDTLIGIKELIKEAKEAN